MVSVLDSSEVDHRFKSRSDQTLVFVASPLSMPYLGERTKMGWLGIRIMCLSGATFLPADCCFSELSTIKIQLNVLV